MGPFYLCFFYMQEGEYFFLNGATLLMFPLYVGKRVLFLNGAIFQVNLQYCKIYKASQNHLLMKSGITAIFYSQYPILRFKHEVSTMSTSKVINKTRFLDAWSRDFLKNDVIEPFINENLHYRNIRQPIRSPTVQTRSLYGVYSQSYG